MIKREVKKIVRYKIVTLEVLRMRNLKTEVITVIAGTTATISKPLRQYLSNTPGQHDIMNYRKQRYWALHTQTAESADVAVQNITLHAAQTVTTEQMQHYVI